MLCQLLPPTGMALAIVFALACGSPPPPGNAPTDASGAADARANIDAPTANDSGHGFDAGIVIDATPAADAAIPGDGPVADASPAADASANDASSPTLDAGVDCSTLAEDAPCDDGDKCTRTDVCRGGVCTGTNPTICTTTQLCAGEGSCDPATGWCGFPGEPDTTPCDDGNICTENDQCTSNACGGTTIPVAFTPCEDGVCFTDVAAASGLAAPAGPPVPRWLTASAAFFDLDGDGLLDLAYGNETTPPRVYRALGTGLFTEVTASVNLPTTLPPTKQVFLGIIAADYDNDGDTDLYYLYDGANTLYRNDGGTFTDATETAGVGDPHNSTAGSFADFDRDGDLDLYVGNYIAVASPAADTPDPNTLYRNNGDGTFTDVTSQHGLAGSGETLSVLWSDFDNDNDLDLFVCNDLGALFEPNRLYINNAGSFSLASDSLGAHVAMCCMGMTPGDVNRDGRLDYYLSNQSANVLLSGGASSFTDVASDSGVCATNGRCFPELPLFSWGAGFQDFDADGWLDLYVTNGHIPLSGDLKNPRESASSLFLGRGTTAPFVDASRSAGAADMQASRSVAFADYDGDGDVDMLAANIQGRPLLLRNDSPAPGNLITVAAQGRLSNRDGIGCRVSVGLPGVSLIQEINPHGGFLSTSEKAVHIGIGGEAEASTVSIRWPLGIEQRLLHVGPGRVDVVEPYVTVATATPDAAVVSEGTQLTADIELTNHKGAAMGVSVTLDLRVPGAMPVSSANTSVSMTSAATTVTSASMIVPVGITGGGAVTAQLIVRVTDAGGGLDEFSVPVSITP